MTCTTAEGNLSLCCVCMLIEFLHVKFIFHYLICSYVHIENCSNCQSYRFIRICEWKNINDCHRKYVIMVRSLTLDVRILN